MSDLRYAIRVLVKSPMLTVAAMVTIALGIAATTVIFSVVNGILLEPLPYRDPDRLVMVWQDLRARGGPPDEWASPAGFFDWKARNRVFESLTAVRGWTATLTGAGEPETIPGAIVSHEYFSVLGATPALGRTFRPEEDLPSGERVVILSHGLWQRRFGGERTVVGRALVLNGESHTVVGVLPQDFVPVIVGAAQIWRPMRIDPASAPRGQIILRVIARLRADVSLEQASAQMTTVARALEQEFPERNKGAGVALVPLHDQIVGPIRRALLVLLAAVGLVLLTACANVANLLMARAAGRGREMAVRVALGAGAARLVRQLLTESLVLAVISGGAGLLLAFWGLDALLAAPAQAPRLENVAIDGGVLAFVAGVTTITGILFGLAPALQATRLDVVHGLKEGVRASSAPQGRRTRQLLVVAELAIALILVAGAGLLLRSFLRLQAVDPGFNPAGVLTARVIVPPVKYDSPSKTVPFFEQLMARLSALPGVRAAGAVSVLPFGGSDTDTSFLIEGRPKPTNPGDTPVAWYRVVTPGYFQAIGLPLLQGRLFTERDRVGAPRVALVNEATARRYWPNEDPIGKRLCTGRCEEWTTIAGVVRDVHHRGLDTPPEVEMYLPHAQLGGVAMTVVLRSWSSEGRTFGSASDATALAAPIRAAVRELDRDVPTSNVATLESLMAQSMAPPRLVTLLVGLFAILAMLLGAVGVYGVMAYSVAQRTGEIGIRLALGADRRQVVAMILRDAMVLAIAGVVVGLAGALAVTRALSSLLFGVSPTDPATFIVTASLLVLVALGAGYLPARRATRVDPVTALRAE